MSNACIAINTNGSAAIGLGHARRCLTLGEALGQLGAQVKFILNDDPVVRDFVHSKGFDTAVVTPNNNAEQTRHILKRWSAIALVTDSYELSTEYWHALHGHVHLLAAIDDLADKYLPVDIVINGSAKTPAVYSTPPHTKFLLGSAYILLRSEFSQEPVREFHERIDRVLITVGGSDPFQLTPRIMRCVSESLESVTMDVVLGPFFENRREIEQEAARPDIRANLHFAPDDMRKLMLTADVAITGGGQTTYELAATATPALAVRIAANQRDNLTGLLQEATLRSVGDVGDGNLLEKLSAMLKELALNSGERKKMAERGRRAVDGLGAQRVANALIEELKLRN